MREGEAGESRIVTAIESSIILTIFLLFLLLGPAHLSPRSGRIEPTRSCVHQQSVFPPQIDLPKRVQQLSRVQITANEQGSLQQGL